MPTAEWNVNFDLVTSVGTLLFNQGNYPRFNINRERCRVRRDVRATTDPIPQGDGDVFHDRWATGVEMTINCQPWLSSEQFACEGLELNGESLVTMRDELYEHLWALLRPASSSDHRMIWTPTGQARRMLDEIRLLSVADPTITKEGLVSFEFTIDTPFPYAISLTQTTTNLNGIGGTVTNNGNVDFWPVLKVYSDGVTIDNQTTGLSILLYAGALGGGSYIEIDTFRMTAYVDGDQANAKPYIDPTLTDFFPIVPGANIIDSSGSVDVLHNDAFA